MSRLPSCLAVLALLAGARAGATPTTDLAALRQVRAGLTGGTAAADTIDDVLAVVPKVQQWVEQGTSGSARQRFDANHRLTGYTVYYQSGTSTPLADRVANLAHELMHAAVNEAHHKDFVNYGNPPDMGKTVPAPVFKEDHGVYFLTDASAADRQTAQKNTSAQNALADKAVALSQLVASSGYSTPQKAFLSGKCQYAASGANSEYDASLTSMLVMCAQWKCSKTTPFYKKLEEMGKEAHLRRTHNARQ